MRCPVDGDVLVRMPLPSRRWAFGCRRCQGRAATLAGLRAQLPDAFRRSLQAAFVQATAHSPLRCPSCSAGMCMLHLFTDGEGYELDVCRQCALIWFDPHELEDLPAKPPAPRIADGLTDEQRAAFAIAAVREVQAHAEREKSERVGEGLRRLPGFFGLPVEVDGELAGRPWGTWSLAAIVAGISLAAFRDDGLLRALAFVPEQWLQRPLSSVTAFFAHVDWLHLVGNLWFLVVFGDNLELHYGRVRWAILLLAATFVASFAHLLGDPDSTRTVVGASGGISGLIACYCLTLPHARLQVFLATRWSVGRWVDFPAWGGGLAWLALQLAELPRQLIGFGSVSVLAHLGGAAVGVVCWLLWRDRA